MSVGHERVARRKRHAHALEALECRDRAVDGHRDHAPDGIARPPGHHPVAEADEDVLDLALGPDQGVLGPDRHGRCTGQGNVDCILRETRAELAGIQLCTPRLEQ